MCTSRNPGMAVLSVTRTSCAPEGTRMPARGPIASITSSRIKMPASLISVVGVNTRPAWIRVVVMAAQHRNGNASPAKTKRASQTRWGARQVRIVELLLGRRCHFDAGQLQRVALHRALYGHVVAGMRRDFVLSIDNVHLFVGIVHEHVLRAMLFDALGRALALAFFRALHSTLAIRNPAGPGAIRRHRECSREERRCNCHRETYFHGFPPPEIHCGIWSAGPPSSLPQRRSHVQTLPLNSYTADLRFWMRPRKKGGFSGILPFLAVHPRSWALLSGNLLIARTSQCSPRPIPPTSARSGSPSPSTW